MAALRPPCSSVDLAEYDVHRADDCHDIGEHMAPAHEIGRLQKGKARRSYLAAIGPVGAVRNQIYPEFALWRLDRGVGFARWDVIAFGVELEVMDESFHRMFHLGPRRRRHLAVVDLARPGRHLRERLPDDAPRLAHLLDPDEITIVGIAVAPDWNVELHLVIGVIGLRAAEIPGHTGAAQHRAGKSPIRSLLGGHHSDVEGALLEDAVLGQQTFDIVDRLREGVAKCEYVRGEPRG